MAGRIGEKVFTKDLGSGASSDIKSATSMARRMVCEWGMSELGPVSFGENQQSLFLGRELTKTQTVSEETLRRIDEQVHAIIVEQYARAEKIISEHAEAHKKIAEALLEYETLDGVHVREILEFGEIRTPIEYKSISVREQEAKAAEEERERAKAEKEKEAAANENAKTDRRGNGIGER